MRSILAIFILVCLGLSVSAQASCNRYFPFKEGQILTYKSYDKKGKLESQQTSEYRNVTLENGKLTVEVHNVTTTAKKVERLEHDYIVECENNEVSLELTSIVGQEVFAPIQGMEMNISGTPLKLPDVLEIGQTLPDGDMIVTADGPVPIKITINISNREIVEKKEIQTEAGTFDCIRLDQDVEVKMIVKSKSRVVQYIAEDLGPIRTETYNANGKLMSYTELVEVGD